MKMKNKLVRGSLKKPSKSNRSGGLSVHTSSTFCLSFIICCVIAIDYFLFESYMYTLAYWLLLKDQFFNLGIGGRFELCNFRNVIEVFELRQQQKLLSRMEWLRLKHWLVSTGRWLQKLSPFVKTHWNLCGLTTQCGKEKGNNGQFQFVLILILLKFVN